MKSKFKPPIEARENAIQAIIWKNKYKLKAGTRVGWIRARQLTKNETVSFDIVKRMSNFGYRHKKNSLINPKFKNTPWKDKGYLMWLAWGGDEGIEWAQNIVK